MVIVELIVYIYLSLFVLQQQEVFVPEQTVERVVVQTPAPSLGIALVNAYRVENGLKVVIESKSVCAYAKLRAEQVKSDWSHNGFLYTKEQPKPGFWVENLAKGFDVPPIEAWKKSATHNANLLADVSEMCLERNGNYWALEGWSYHSGAN